MESKALKVTSVGTELHNYNITVNEFNNIIITNRFNYLNIEWEVNCISGYDPATGKVEVINLNTKLENLQHGQEKTKTD